MFPAVAPGQIISSSRSKTVSTATNVDTTKTGVPTVDKTMIDTTKIDATKRITTKTSTDSSDSASRSVHTVVKSIDTNKG